MIFFLVLIDEGKFTTLRVVGEQQGDTRNRGMKEGRGCGGLQETGGSLWEALTASARGRELQPYEQ